jgi:hypothetical protein
VTRGSTIVLIASNVLAAAVRIYSTPPTVGVVGAGKLHPARPHITPIQQAMMIQRRILLLLIVILLLSPPGSTMHRKYSAGDRSDFKKELVSGFSGQSPQE